MAIFTYRAINEDGKETRGTLEALSADAAVKALEDLHLDVLEVNEAMRIQRRLEAAPVNLSTTFVFDGIDVHGTERKGSIVARSKRDAYDQLRRDQQLTLQSITEQGATAVIPDTDVLQWNSELEVPRSPAPPPRPKPTPQSQSQSPTPLRPPSPPVAQKRVDSPILPKGTLSPASPTQTPTPPKYLPLFSTLRLYAGWLLAWYGLFVALGYYANVRILPWDIPFVEAFFVSPLIFTFIVAVFLLLALNSLHRALGGRLLLGSFLTLLWASAIAAVRLSL